MGIHRQSENYTSDTQCSQSLSLLLMGGWKEREREGAAGRRWEESWKSGTLLLPDPSNVIECDIHYACLLDGIFHLRPYNFFGTIIVKSACVLFCFSLFSMPSNNQYRSMSIPGLLKGLLTQFQKQCFIPWYLFYDTYPYWLYVVLAVPYAYAYAYHTIPCETQNAKLIWHVFFRVQYGVRTRESRSSKISRRPANHQPQRVHVRDHLAGGSLSPKWD